MKLKLYKIWKWIQHKEQNRGMIFVIIFIIIVAVVICSTIWGHWCYDQMNPSYKCPMSDRTLAPQKTEMIQRLDKENAQSHTKRKVPVEESLSPSQCTISSGENLSEEPTSTRDGAKNENSQSAEISHDWGEHAWIAVSKYPLGSILLAFFIVWTMRSCWQIMSRKCRLIEEDEKKSHLRPEDLPIFIQNSKVLL